MKDGVPANIDGMVRYGSFQQVDNLKIHVWGMGGGYPVVLIHGFTGTAYDWRFNIPELARHFSTYAFDLPGFGYSQKPLNFEYNADGYADFVLSFLDARDIDKAVLVGNSLGGHVALQTCARYPHRVSGLVLIDSGGYPGSMQFPLFQIMAVPVLGNIAMQLLSRFTIRQVLKHVIFYDASFATRDAVSEYFNVYLTANARKIPAVVVRNMKLDEREIPGMLKYINCPVQIIWGQQDRVIPSCWATCFSRDINNSSLIIIPGAGHMPQVEKAEVVNHTVCSFVQKVRQR